MSKNKKRIKIKIKKARKLFATVVSRGPNIVRTEKEDKQEEKEQDNEEDSERKNERIFSPPASHALCKQLDGTLDFEQGTTGWWSMRAAKGYGSVLKKDYDLNLENATKEDYRNFLRTPLPHEALENAAKFRVGWYERLYSASDIVRSLPYTPSSICFKIFKGIYKAPRGFVPMPHFWDARLAVIRLQLLDIVIRRQTLKFLNSWGKEWGDGGLGRLSYRYVDKYLIEAWACMHQLEKNGKRGEVKKDGEYEYESIVYRSLIFGRQPLYVIDVYFDGKDKIAGWVHFRFDDLGNTINIEDIFVMPEFRRKGIGRKLLSEIEDLANKQFVPKIVCYVHSQDLLTEDNISAIENLFGRDKYEILPYTKRFAGCKYKVVSKRSF